MSSKSDVVLVVTPELNQALLKSKHEDLYEALRRYRSDLKVKDGAVLYHWNWVKWRAYEPGNFAYAITKIIREDFGEEDYRLVVVREDNDLEEGGEFTDVFNPEAEISSRIIYDEPEQEQPKIKHFIFVTGEGSTSTPSDEEINNLQVIGFAKGTDSKDAYDTLKEENPGLINKGFNELTCYELGAQLPKNYFYLKSDREEDLEVESVHWKAVTDDFVTYEFSIKGLLYEEDSGCYVELFRLFLWNNGNEEILVANDTDYDIHEDVSNSFDIDKIKAICLAAEVDDMTKEYLEHYEQRREEGEDV